MSTAPGELRDGELMSCNADKDVSFPVKCEIGMISTPSHFANILAHPLSFWKYLFHRKVVINEQVVNKQHKKQTLDNRLIRHYTFSPWLITQALYLLINLLRLLSIFPYCYVQLFYLLIFCLAPYARLSWLFIRVVVSISASRSRDGLETYFSNVSVSSRSRATTSRLQVNI